MTSLRQHSKTFYLASLFLGKNTARLVARLYSFCRAVDDLADKEANKKLAEVTLQQWQHQVQTGVAIAPAVRDVLQLAEEKQLNPQDIALLIQGVKSDLHPVCMADEAELTRYCFLVAGTVGLLMCQLLGHSNACAKKFAVDLGIAMQLTNILRDVAEDAKMGRQYIPRTWMHEYVDFFRATATTQALIKPALEQLFNLAERYYASGYAGLRYLPLRNRFGVLLAARLYQEIGVRAKKAGFNVWDKRISVSRARKACLLGQCVFIWIKHSCTWKKPLIHDASLHVALLSWLQRL